MARSDASIQSHNSLIAASAAVREYAGSAQSVLVVSMLDSLMASYLLDLIDVDKDGVEALQSKIKQTDAIRDVIAGNGAGTPKI